MAKVSLEFTGDDADLQKALTRMNAELVKLTEKNAKLAQQSRASAKVARESSDDQKVSLERVVAAAGLATAGWTALNGAIAVGRTLVQGYRQEVIDLERSASTAGQALKSAFLNSRDVENSPRVQRFVNLPLPGSSRAERTEAFRGVSEAAPAMQLEDRLKLATQVSRAAPLGNSGEIGALAGELGDALPDRKPADLVDLALSLRQRAGDQANKLSDPNFQRAVSLIRKTGYGPEEALALGLQTLDSNVGIKTLEAYAIKGAEGGDALRKRIGEVDFTKAKTLADAIRGDVAGDYVGDQLTALRKTSTGQADLAQRSVASRAEYNSLNEEFKAQQIVRARGFLTQQERAADMTALNPSRLVGRATYEGLVVTAAAAGDQQPGLAALQAGGMLEGKAGQAFQKNEMQIYQAFTREMAELRQELAKQTRAIEAQPTKDDAKSAARQNATSDLDRHNEGR